MTIRRSSATDVARLIDELSSDNALRRETAAARLAVTGARAVTRLMALASDAAAAVHARVAALRALESIGDPRSLATAEALADAEGELGLAAIALMGAVARTGDPRATRAFDWLASLALDGRAAEHRRLVALTALNGLPPRHLAPIYAALTSDPSAALAARAARQTAGAAAGTGEPISLDTAIETGLPDDPSLVSAMIHEDADATKVTALRRLIEAIRARERNATGELQRLWMTARGQVHRALAARGSRLALYDLRETLERADGPLPVGFLAAAASVGDAACLEPLAAAWVSAPPDDHWWRDHLVDAFGAIVKREALTRRHPVLKRILERQPAAAVLVAMARK